MYKYKYGRVCLCSYTRAHAHQIHLQLSACLVGLFLDDFVPFGPKKPNEGYWGGENQHVL